MGADEARAVGLVPTVIGVVPAGVSATGWPQTTGADSERAAADLLAAGIDLLLFAGGDGTARNMFNAVGDRVPVLGIPAGVKIHSAVYATTPLAAGDLAAHFLAAPPGSQRLRAAEVMDIDEAAFRDNRVSARLYGYLTVPYERALIQSAKAGGVAGDEQTMAGIADDVISGMEPGCLYIVGPGTTTRTILERLGLPKTLLGVDAVRDRALVGRDLSERQILSLLDDSSAAALGRTTLAASPLVPRSAASPRIVVTVIGGQGHIFGRGNQQISPRVLQRVGVDNVIVVASQTKLLSLGGEPLLVDTGDAAVDALFAGYVRVVTAQGERTMYRVRAQG
jgi:predicted polyphosphate/ATP-dependent NAD kinase